MQGFRTRSSLAQALKCYPPLGPDHSFDLTFVDADKKSNPIYYPEAKRIVKKGGIIIVDNVVRNARTSNMSVQGASDIDGVCALLKIVKEDKEVDATTLGTVGETGYDGFAGSFHEWDFGDSCVESCIKGSIIVC